MPTTLQYPLERHRYLQRRRGPRLHQGPPDHTERKKVPSQLLARVVSSPIERSASRRPSPTILLSQG
jgi:hypothetical protein